MDVNNLCYFLLERSTARREVTSRRYEKMVKSNMADLTMSYNDITNN